MTRTDEASRIIPADPGRIWDALVDPASVVVWLPPDGMTWLLSPVAEGTAVVVRAKNVPRGIAAEDHATGLASSLAQLATFIGGANQDG